MILVLLALMHAGLAVGFKVIFLWLQKHSVYHLSIPFSTTTSVPASLLPLQTIPIDELFMIICFVYDVMLISVVTSWFVKEPVISATRATEVWHGIRNRAV